MFPSRFSILGLMAAISVLAADLALIRSLHGCEVYIWTSKTTTVSLLFFACGVLPMATLLTLAAIFRLPGLLRTGESATPLVGFLLGGFASILGFLGWSYRSPTAVSNYADAVGLWIAAIIPSAMNNAPEAVGNVVEFTLLTLTFGLPELAVALFGRWLLRRSGISILILRRSPESDSEPRPRSLDEDRE